MSFPLGSPTSVRKTSTACLLSFHAQMASSCIFFTWSSVTHPPHCLKLPFHKNVHGWISQIIMLCLPLLIIGESMKSVMPCLHAMPSITELVLYEWWSMLSNDISDLNLGFKPLICYPLDLVHHARPLRPYGHARPLLMIIQGLYFFCASALHISSGVVFILVLAREKKSWFGWLYCLPNQYDMSHELFLVPLIQFFYHCRVCFCLFWGWAWCWWCDPRSWQYPIWLWQAQAVCGVGQGMTFSFSVLISGWLFSLPQIIF